jgi:hypothetical protein
MASKHSKQPWRACVIFTLIFNNIVKPSHVEQEEKVKRKLSQHMSENQLVNLAGMLFPPIRLFQSLDLGFINPAR